VEEEKVARAQEGTATMVEGGDEDALTPTPSEMLLLLLLSSGEQCKEGLHGAGLLGAGLGPPPRDQREEGRGR
jgi:hypothetical protein